MAKRKSPSRPARQPACNIVPLLAETLIPISQSKSKLPGGPCPKSLSNWYRFGIPSKLDPSVIVQLECTYIGRTLWTSTEAYRRFLIRLNGGA